MDETKQILANMIQLNEQLLKMARAGYKDDKMLFYFTTQVKGAKGRIASAKKQLKDVFDIDYDSASSSAKVLKEGSKVKVLVDHSPGTKGATGEIKKYSLSAFTIDLEMEDKTSMKNFKWLTNEEVELK